VKEDKTDCACCVKNVCRALVGTEERKTPNRRPRSRRKHINIGLREIGMEGVNYEGWNFNSGNYLFTTDTK